MAISFTRYVDITSGVSGTAPVRQRQLITRIYSGNALIPTNSFAEFDNLADVGTYFGTGSEEYARASFYFSFVSKTAVAPQKISFASWVETPTSPHIFGDNSATATLSSFQTVTNGSMVLTIGAETETLTGLNFSTATALGGATNSVSSILQAAIRAAFPSDTSWSAATVAFAGGFQLNGGKLATSASLPVAVAAPPSGTDVGAMLGWESPNTIFSFGSPAMTLTATMNASVAASNNFASFAFVTNLALSPAQIEELATWNAAQNFQYMGLFAVSVTTAAAISAAILQLAGNTMTLSPLAAEFPEMVPGIILAATDYTKNNASQNYMFQTFPLTPAVSDDNDANVYDAERVNYYGITQSAGQTIAFYQRGVMTGGNTAATDMNVYANEIWFKSAASVAWLSLLLAVNQVSTNAAGKSLALATLQPIIQQALRNGTISPGQTLTAQQIAVINGIVGDTTTYLQIQSIGYWVDGNFSSTVTVDGRTEWQFNYQLIYTKNNAIRKVVGTHNLI